MSRDLKFGQLLAIANVLSERVFEKDKMFISQKYMSRFSKNPAKTFEKIHSELMEYTDKFKEDEINFMNLFGEILAGMNESEFTNEPLSAKYLHGYYTQQNDLNNIIGVDEAAEILGFSPGTVKNKCAAGDIPAKKIGKTWVIDKTKIEQEKSKKAPTQ